MALRVLIKSLNQLCNMGCVNAAGRVAEVQFPRMGVRFDSLGYRIPVPKKTDVPASWEEYTHTDHPSPASPSPIHINF